MNFKNVFKAYFYVFLLGGFFSSTTFAQDFSEEEDLLLLYGDEETVSIATGSSKPLRLAPSVASVITSDDIRKMGARDLDDILETIPGVHVSLSTRYSSLISIRGIHTASNPQVLMLINGYPITELFTGARAPTFRLPVHNIERVEVIRGPGSAVFGADAFSGVINVITKSSTDTDGVEVGLQAGSFDTYSAWFNYGTDVGEWNFGLSVELTQSKGDDDRIIDADSQTTLLDPLTFLVTGNTASLAPGSVDTEYDILNSQLELSKGGWQFRLNSWIQDDGGIGIGAAYALDPSGTQQVDQHLLDLSYTSDSDNKDWSYEVHLNYFYLKQDTFFRLLPPGAVAPIGMDGNIDPNPFTAVGAVLFTDGLIGTPGGTDENLSLEYVGYYERFQNHQIRIATGIKKQSNEAREKKNFGPGIIDGTIPVVDGTLTDVTGTPLIFLRDRDREIKHISVQDAWAFLPDWELTAGVRFDDYSDFGNTVNPRLALVWQTNYNLTSKFLYGRAFRAPTFSEQFAINNPVVNGNPEVDPEEIDTVELSFDYRPTYDLNIRLNLFSYDIDGLIDFVDDDGILGGTSTAQNVFDQEGQGFEVELNWDLSNTVSLISNYAYQDSENKSTGSTVADAPSKQLFLGLDWQVSNQWHLNAEFHRVMDRTRSMGDIRDDLDNDSVVNLTLTSAKIFGVLDVSVSVRNLFDEDLYEPTDVNSGVPNDQPLSGRSLLLETKFYFWGD
ncbi:hypothetical protein NBRC116493_24560 [Aurantivibrio infirmus]